MSVQGVFPKNKLNDFKAWLQSSGWTLYESKNPLEVLRAFHPNRNRPLSLYSRRDSPLHYSFAVCDYPLVQTFMSGTSAKTAYLKTEMDKATACDVILENLDYVCVHTKDKNGKQLRTALRIAMACIKTCIAQEAENSGVRKIGQP